MDNRRDFIKKTALTTAGIAAVSSNAFSAKSYNKIIGANDRVRVGIIGFSQRFRSSLAPSFADHSKDLNFEFMGVSDIWNRRRDEAAAYFKGKPSAASDFVQCRNNDELLDRKDVDAVIISTADFQHALHSVAAIKSGRDVYLSLIHI